MSSLLRFAPVALIFAPFWLANCSSTDAPSLGSSGSGAFVTAGAAASVAGSSAGNFAGSGGAATAGAPSVTGGSASAGSPSSITSDLFEGAVVGQLAAFDSAAHTLLPTGLWGALKKPLPTNAWWQNLVLGKGESPVNVLPYLVAATEAGLRVCQPKQVTEPSYTFSVMANDLVLSAAEAFTGRAVVAHDALSVTLEWKSASGAMRLPLVEGMAYVSAHYQGLRPKLSSAHAVVSVNGAAPGRFSAARFELQLDNGQTWRVYSSQSLAWTWDGTQLQSSDPLTGWLRVALSNGAAMTSLLDEHAESIPTGGAVRAEAANDVATMVFDWQTEGPGAPLMMALPHHLPTLQTAVSPISLPTIRGPMLAVAGKQWLFHEPLTRIAFSAPRPIPADKKAAILDALRADAQSIQPTSEEPYFFGKQIGAVARLALIADELGEAALATELRGKLKAWLAPWLAGGSGSRLVYDSSWGGLVSKPGLADAGADFGLGWYNDHHFQFGYFIYVAAVIALEDEAWVASNRSAIEVVLRDYASPQADDYFPAYRCKDWFVGHSWAAGVFEFVDSRNQESTSEAINGYYAVYLWGLATKDARMRDFGRLLLTTEIRSAQTYWQIKDDSIYPAPFSDRKIVGVLWAIKADHNTWFGNQLEFIHGIQWMPFTPMSEELLPRDWMAQSYPLVAGALGRAEPAMGEGWRGLVHMAHAIIDAPAAWTEVTNLSTFDDGNSRTNALYWVATR